jgi:hypothetical protein
MVLTSQDLCLKSSRLSHNIDYFPTGGRFFVGNLLYGWDLGDGSLGGGKLEVVVGT